MKAAQPPIDENERQATLDALNIMYSPAELRFDRITRLAQQLFDVPIALVSLVSRDRQWFKSAQGLSADQTPRAVSFCGHALHSDECFQVEDAYANPDFSDNPLVTGAPNLRFYAGQPVHFGNKRLGTLCLIDRKKRQLTESELETLGNLARWVDKELAASALSQSQAELLAGLNERQRAGLIDPVMRSWNRAAGEILVPRELGSLPENTESAAFLVGWDFSPEPTEDERDQYANELAQVARSVVAPDDLIVALSPAQMLLLTRNRNHAAATLLGQRLLGQIQAVMEPRCPHNLRCDIRGIHGRISNATELDEIIRLCAPLKDARFDAERSTFALKTFADADPARLNSA